jgi:hypothetical protein
MRLSVPWKKITGFPLIVSALLAAFVILGILGAILNSVPERNARPQPVMPLAGESPLNLQNSLIPPEGPALPDDYLLYRERHIPWPDDEVSRWFTVPDAGMLRELHESNGALISDLLKAAP